MATNHDETLQERYARELAAMEPKTPMVKVMASNWQEDGLAPTWQQLLKAQIEYDELRARVVALAADAARLDALDLLKESYGFQDMHEGNRWKIEGPFRNVREAIDAAMKGE